LQDESAKVTFLNCLTGLRTNTLTGTIAILGFIGFGTRDSKRLVDRWLFGFEGRLILKDLLALARTAGEVSCLSSMSYSERLASLTRFRDFNVDLPL
jgi:hypothetical protein